MKILKRNLPFLVIVLGGIFLSASILNLAIPKAEPIFGTNNHTKKAKSDQKDVIRLVALGDSLTQGVGDTTDSGGYVPLIAQTLTDDIPLNAVQTNNFGKSGDRSDQILKRLKKSEEMQEDLKEADVIVLTVGGNDLMKVVRSELLNNITEKTFIKPEKAYKKNLEELYTEIRKYNKKAPIYQFGIYNPFYLNFSDLKEMQTIVDNWNQVAEDFVDEQKLAHFIPINDLMYKGRENGVGVVQDSEQSTSNSSTEASVNNLISDLDNFHPNNLGYQIMSNALRDELLKTKDEWLIKSK